MKKNIKKQMSMVVMSTIIAGGTLFAVEEKEAVASELKAIPTQSKVIVDGERVEFEAYNIDDNNYFKLRDLAFILSGTDNQFDVTWDESKQAINLKQNQKYSVVGNEMSVGKTQEQNAVSNTASIYLEGKEISMLAYNMGGNTYFKLRDVGTVFGFNVDWDGSSVLIQTTKGTTETTTDIEKNIRAFEEEIVRLTNIERANEGLAPLEIFEPAMDLARAKSQEMADENYFSHYDENGVYMYKELQQYSGTLAENISAGRMNAQAIVDGWMNSAGHKANILNANYKYIGVGYGQNSSSKYKYYATQMFLGTLK